MIDRDILLEPNKPIDFFNDYGDTYNWLVKNNEVLAANALNKRRVAYYEEQERKNKDEQTAAKKSKSSRRK